MERVSGRVSRRDGGAADTPRIPNSAEHRIVEGNAVDGEDVNGLDVPAFEEDVARGRGARVVPVVRDDPDVAVDADPLELDVLGTLDVERGVHRSADVVIDV